MRIEWGRDDFSREYEGFFLDNVPYGECAEYKAFLSVGLVLTVGCWNLDKDPQAWHWFANMLSDCRGEPVGGSGASLRHASSAKRQAVRWATRWVDQQIYGMEWKERESDGRLTLDLQNFRFLVFQSVHDSKWGWLCSECDFTGRQAPLTLAVDNGYDERDAAIVAVRLWIRNSWMVKRT